MNNVNIKICENKRRGYLATIRILYRSKTTIKPNSCGTEHCPGLQAAAETYYFSGNGFRVSLLKSNSVVILQIIQWVGATGSRAEKAQREGQYQALRDDAKF